MREVHAALEPLDHTYEVVVVDDGSVDDSVGQALSAGARVVQTERRAGGVGAALRVGAVAAEGRWLVFLDADGEHDPADVPRLLEPLADGEPALVLGSRTLGGYAPGARSLLHSRVGTPALTGALNLLLGTRITDCNTGFRAIPKAAYLELGQRAVGMEFASEMIALAARQGLPIVEVPVRQRAGPEGRQPHLRRWRDGWRHLETIALHAPDQVLLRPGAAIAAVGALLFTPQIFGPVRWGLIALDIHLMILGALLLLIGVEMVGGAIVCATLAGPAPNQGAVRSLQLGARFVLGRVLPWAGLLFAAGLAADVLVVVKSGLNGWQGIMEPRLALLGTTTIAIAVQLVVLSFVHTVVGRSPRAL